MLILNSRSNFSRFLCWIVSLFAVATVPLLCLNSENICDTKICNSHGFYLHGIDCLLTTETKEFKYILWCNLHLYSTIQIVWSVLFCLACNRDFFAISGHYKLLQTKIFVPKKLACLYNLMEFCQYNNSKNLQRLLEIRQENGFNAFIFTSHWEILKRLP